MQILGLPLQVWDLDIIKGVVKAIGPLIAIDLATKNKSRLINNKFYVLVRCDKPLLDSVRIESNKWSKE